MSQCIRLATPDDADRCLEIYLPFVTNSATSFETEPPGSADMRRRIADTLQSYPWLVMDAHHALRGYVYASPHRTRAAYRWTVEVAVYVHPDARRQRVGSALYLKLFRLLAAQNFYHAYGGIALPNPASVALHESVGFRRCALYERIGFKLGAWHDVGWWHRALRPTTAAPDEPIPFRDFRDSDAFHAIMRSDP